jgi:hypothetical protein
VLLDVLLDVLLPGLLSALHMPLSLSAGLATYMNVAITDPLLQKGLLALDDAELAQSGPAAAAALTQQGPAAAAAQAQQQTTKPATPVGDRLTSNMTSAAEGLRPLQLGSDVERTSFVIQALQDGLLYVVAVSRDCSGVCADTQATIASSCLARALHLL